MATNGRRVIEFLDLPREVRDIIYDFDVRDKPRVVKGFGKKRRVITSSCLIGVNYQVASEYLEACEKAERSHELHHLDITRDFLDWTRLPRFPQDKKNRDIYIRYNVRYQNETCGCLHLRQSQRHRVDCQRSFEEHMWVSLYTHRKMIRKMVRSAEKVNRVVVEFSPVGFPCDCTAMKKRITMSGPRQSHFFLGTIPAMIVRLVALVFPTACSPRWESYWPEAFLCPCCRALREITEAILLQTPTARSEMVISKGGWGVFLNKRETKRSTKRSTRKGGTRASGLQYTAAWEETERFTGKQRKWAQLFAELQIEKEPNRPWFWERSATALLTVSASLDRLAEDDPTFVACFLLVMLALAIMVICCSLGLGPVARGLREARSLQR
ncbi:hypothetical protein PRZ48_009000 [Zasmidium cellare]|uniref:Uncharacterized protein n=1 Tax=Zasmidium cellare TaxID=395010 RepID=A0ABR0EHZ0_ZASCE|nr:hypothetical protein PRZ48_009000 [Zasmidium cellare]